MKPKSTLPKFRKGQLVRIINGGEQGIIKSVHNEGNTFWYVVGDIPLAEFEIEAIK